MGIVTVSVTQLAQCQSSIEILGAVNVNLKLIMVSVAVRPHNSVIKNV